MNASFLLSSHSVLILYDFYQNAARLIWNNTALLQGLFTASNVDIKTPFILCSSESI
jgi:hypothetical protein